jgi:hypothetical protein
MQKIVEGVKIDPAAVVPCPEIDFKMRRATKCEKCECFAGIGLMNATEGLPWGHKYTIRCAHVMERRVQMFEVEGE